MDSTYGNTLMPCNISADGAGFCAGRPKAYRTYSNSNVEYAYSRVIFHGCCRAPSLPSFCISMKRRISRQHPKISFSLRWEKDKDKLILLFIRHFDNLQQLFIHFPFPFPRLHLFLAIVFFAPCHRCGFRAPAHSETLPPHRSGV